MCVSNICRSFACFPDRSNGYGKSIVASILLASEVIDDGVNGYLVHPTQHKAYANRILTLLESPDLRNQFGLSARKSVIEKFSTTNRNKVYHFTKLW
jgi:glycosyltransferase involved in cell wall biosynthesis